MASIFSTTTEYYQQLCALVRAAGADDGAISGVIGLSFLYGVFQATGPDYKAAISSYPVRDLETWRRGLAWSFASALLQATAAVALVALFSAVLRATATTMGFAVDLVELVSYALIMLIGLRLLFAKGRGFFAMLQHRPDDGGPATWHAHLPRPVEFAAPNGSKRALAAAFAVWVPPWSGAILVLIFALAQGLFWVGVTAAFMMGAGSALTMAVIATIAVTDSARTTRFCNASSHYGVLAWISTARN